MCEEDRKGREKPDAMFTCGLAEKWQLKRENVRKSNLRTGKIKNNSNGKDSSCIYLTFFKTHLNSLFMLPHQF